MTEVSVADDGEHAVYALNVPLNANRTKVNSVYFCLSPFGDGVQSEQQEVRDANWLHQGDNITIDSGALWMVRDLDTDLDYDDKT